MSPARCGIWWRRSRGRSRNGSCAASERSAQSMIPRSPALVMGPLTISSWRKALARQHQYTELFPRRARGPSPEAREGARDTSREIERTPFENDFGLWSRPGALRPRVSVQRHPGLRLSIPRFVPLRSARTQKAQRTSVSALPNGTITPPETPTRAWEAASGAGHTVKESGGACLDTSAVWRERSPARGGTAESRGRKRYREPRME